MRKYSKFLVALYMSVVTLSVFTSCDENLIDLSSKFVGEYTTVQKDHYVDANGQYTDTTTESLLKIESLEGEMVRMTGFAVTDGLVDDNTIQFNNCESTIDYSNGLVRTYHFSFTEATLVSNTLTFTANYTCQDNSGRTGSGQIKVTAKKKY